MIQYDHHIDYRISLVNDTTVRKTAKAYKNLYTVTKAVVNHFILHPDPMVVPVYSFNTIAVPTSSFGSYEYSYDMMRLGMLSASEKRIIHNMLDDHPEKYYDERDSYPALVSFMNKVIEENKHFDLHSGNIMKDMYDDYRLIDLESFYDYDSDQGLNAPYLDWVTKS